MHNSQKIQHSVANPEKSLPEKPGSDPFLSFDDSDPAPQGRKTVRNIIFFYIHSTFLSLVSAMLKNVVQKLQKSF